MLIKRSKAGRTYTQESALYKTALKMQINTAYKSKDAHDYYLCAALAYRVGLFDRAKVLIGLSKLFKPEPKLLENLNKLEKLC